jgi:hypothetical protein
MFATSATTKIIKELGYVLSSNMKPYYRICQSQITFIELD